MRAPQSCFDSGSRKIVVAFRFPPPPTGPELEKLRSSHADDEDRNVARPFRHVLDQVEERRFSPVEVVEADNEEASDAQVPRRACVFPRNLPPRMWSCPPGRAGRRCGSPQGLPPRRAEYRNDLALDTLGRVLLVNARRQLDHFDRWPERDPFAVGWASPEQDCCIGPDFFEQLGDEARLSDARGAEDREQDAGALGNGSFVSMHQQLELTCPSHHGRAGPAGMGRGAGRHSKEAVSVEVRGLPFDGERTDRFDLDGVPDEAAGLLGDQDLPRGGAPLQALGHVHGVPRDERLPAGWISGDHLAASDAHPDPEAQAELPLEVLVELGKLLAHLDGGADCSQSVVLVHMRNAEYRHDGVADEFLDGAAVALEHRAHLVEVASHHPP